MIDTSDAGMRKFELLRIMRGLDPRKRGFESDREYYREKRTAHWPTLTEGDRYLVTEAEKAMAARFKAIGYVKGAAA